MSYPPVNECIYCRTLGEPLTKEHIIPYALNGNIILPKASCKGCAAITSVAEREFTRGTYGFYRAEHGIKSRNKKRQANLFNTEVTLDGETYTGEKVTIKARAGDAPTPAGVLRLQSPGIILGHASDALGEMTIELPHSRDGKLRALREKHGLAKLSGYTLNYPYNSTLQVLAKIAHSYAVAEYGINGFEHALVDHILNGPANGVSQWYYVGEHSPPRQQQAQALEIRQIDIAGNIWLVVDISLHFNPKMPLYQVVAGKLIAGADLSEITQNTTDLG